MEPEGDDDDETKQISAVVGPELKHRAEIGRGRRNISTMAGYIRQLMREDTADLGEEFLNYDGNGSEASD